EDTDADTFTVLLGKKLSQVFLGAVGNFDAGENLLGHDFIPDQFSHVFYQLSPSPSIQNPGSGPALVECPRFSPGSLGISRETYRNSKQARQLNPTEHHRQQRLSQLHQSANERI